MAPWLSLWMAVQSLVWHAAPPGTPVHVRLTKSVGSFASRNHSAIEAVLIAPVKAGGEIILPSGSILSGEVKSVRRVGLGLIHETASLQLNFEEIKIPDGEQFPLETRLAAVDNGREYVTPVGSIREMRSTASVGNRAAFYIRRLAMLEVHAQFAVWAAKAVIAQLPEPEIYLPAGTELTLTLTAPVLAPAMTNPIEGPPQFTNSERDSLRPVMDDLPERTSAKLEDRPSDPINVVFLGSREEISAAFQAAGWMEARKGSVHSNLASAWALVRNERYNDAPMSSLRLNDAPADMSWEKGFNDVAKRHHIRLWRQPEMWEGQEIWVGAATRDIDFTYLRKGAWMTHKIAQQIDRERDKVADDVAFAGCADTVDWWDRPRFPAQLTNATGDPIETDGRLAVIRLNECSAPQTIAGDSDPLPVHGKMWQRFLRRQIMCARNELIRANVYWRSYEGARMLVLAYRHRHHVQDPDAPPQPSLASRLFPDRVSTIFPYR